MAVKPTGEASCIGKRIIKIYGGVNFFTCLRQDFLTKDEQGALAFVYDTSATP